MRLMLKSVLAALFHMLSFSMAESKFAAIPEYAATHSLLTELVWSQTAPYSRDFY